MLTSITIILLSIQVLNAIISAINKKENEKITLLTKLQIGFAIIGFGCGIAIFLLNEDKNELNHKFEKQYRDSLDFKLAQRDREHQIQDSLQSIFYVNRLDSSYQKSIKSSNEALAKYNLILIDSLNTVTKKVNFKSIKEPQLIISPAAKNATPPIYFKSDSIESQVVIKIESKNNTSYKVKLNYIVLKIQNNNNYFIYSTVDTGGLVLDKNYMIENIFTTIEIPVKKECMHLEDGLVMLYGNFSNSPDSPQLKNFQEGFGINFETREIGGQLPAFVIDDIYQKVKKRGIIK
jgi:hypothetical protein